MKTYANLTDEQLIPRILEKDNEALSELYNRYYRKVYQKCLTIVKDHDEAFDLAEESLMRAFEKLNTFKGESAFGTWMYSITHRHCLGFLRKHNKVSLQSWNERLWDDEEMDRAEEMSEADTQDEQESIMFSLLNSLPEDERRLLLMKYNQGESIESLQSTLHLSASAVKMRLKRSKDKLNALYTVALSSGLATALSLL